MSIYLAEIESRLIRSYSTVTAVEIPEIKNADRETKQMSCSELWARLNFGATNP